jgi:transketolase
MPAPDISQLQELAKLLRYYCLISTSAAGSGHPTSSLSAVELMTALMFGGKFRFRLHEPKFHNNDRLIFSKGHASPLFYALWAAAGALDEEELLTLRQFGSRLEGHPTLEFPYTEVPTGSLGQGLSVGVGMAMNAKYLDQLPYSTYVLLGDSEMAEGSNWEAIQLAAYYKLHNLVGILDVNRLGQRGETMYGHDVDAYQKRVAAFGWETVVVDGHNLEEILTAYEQAKNSVEKPTMIIARTIKGKGVSLWEDQENWHSKTLNEEQLQTALAEIGAVNKNLRGILAEPENVPVHKSPAALVNVPAFSATEKIATKKAFGTGVTKLFHEHSNIVVLDAEVSNSSHAEIFKHAYPENFFEMFIAEQNMVGTALGLAKRGKLPFVSTFAAFFSRAYDQIRMSQYAHAQIAFVGSYGGVSLGMDGASQMGLEDISFFRTLLNSIVLYPSDAVSAEKMCVLAAKHPGITYIRTTREPTSVLYSPDEIFTIGGSKILRSDEFDVATVIGAGITVQEALRAYDILQKEKIHLRVIDLYSVKPLDTLTLKLAAEKTKNIIIVEDHFRAGGIGEAVRGALAEMQVKNVSTYSLCVRKVPHSGKPQELLEYEGISAEVIVKKVREIISQK